MKDHDNLSKIKKGDKTFTTNMTKGYYSKKCYGYIKLQTIVKKQKRFIKTTNSPGFLTFSRGIDMKHYIKMGLKYLCYDTVIKSTNKVTEFYRLKTRGLANHSTKWSRKKQKFQITVQRNKGIKGITNMTTEIIIQSRV